MAVITTKILGNNEADPKPATAFDYAGQPIKPGGYYNGRPEHSAPRVASIAHARKYKRTMSAERRKAFGERMRAYWAQRKTASHEATQSKSDRDANAN